MSNPYLSFLASLGGPSGSHTTLKKLAASPPVPATRAALDKPSPSRPKSSPSESSPHHRKRESLTDHHHSKGGLPKQSNGLSTDHHAHRHERSDSKNRSGHYDRPYSNKGSDDKDRHYSVDNPSGRRSSANEPRSRKRNARSRSWTRSQSPPRRRDRSRSRSRRSRSRSRNRTSPSRPRKRSRSTSRRRRSRSRSRNRSRSRSPVRHRRPSTHHESGAVRNGHSHAHSTRTRSRSPQPTHRHRRRSRSRSTSRDRGRRSRSRSTSRRRVKSPSPKRHRDRAKRSKSPDQRKASPVPTPIRSPTPTPAPTQTLTPAPTSTPTSAPLTATLARPSEPSTSPTSHQLIPDPHVSQLHFEDDTSSFSTLSSPSSFTPSPPYQPNPTHLSPTKEYSPLKKSRVESFLPENFSSPSLSSSSPLSSFHTSSERDSAVVSPTHDDDIDSTVKVTSQQSLEMELFGAITKLPKKEASQKKPKALKPSKKPASSDDEEYSLLGSKKATTKSNGQRLKRPLNKKMKEAKERTREIVVITTGTGIKATATVRHVPYTTKPKPSMSFSSTTLQKSPIESSATTPTSTHGGSTSTTPSTGGPRRTSILHSDQIVASAVSRYKNHFHMLVEDSDSTVASNPSSTGADMMHVSLEYPGKDSKEKFTLMKPFLSRSKTETDDKDEYNPIEDLVSTVKVIIDHFFGPEKQKELFGTSTEGLYRNLTKFKNRKDGAQFMKAVEDFNQIMTQHKHSGAIQQHVKEYGHRLPYDLVVHVLQQVYSRTVAARASKLNQYEAFSNNVYGEILPILTKEFIQKTKLNENKVFVDLGCGIGNVVLQVALQTGAESYGVEIMDTPAKFAKKQAKEFEARSRAYGLHHGKVTMIQGDFLDTPDLAGILQRADVVLVNNYAFNSALNQSLLQLFLDLKEGCKIISLKTFVSLDHKINVRNAGSVESILRVKKYPYYTNAVSWTHNGGEYFIATVDRTAVQAFWERAMSNGGAGLDDGGRRSSRRR